ncbi:hypothetical protein D3C87_1043100 [compost metagenome]
MKIEYLRLAKKYGVEVIENSANPGLYIIDKNGNEKKVDVVELFEPIFPGIQEIDV